MTVGDAIVHISDTFIIIVGLLGMIYVISR